MAPLLQSHDELARFEIAVHRQHQRGYPRYDWCGKARAEIGIRLIRVAIYGRRRDSEVVSSVEGIEAGRTGHDRAAISRRCAECDLRAKIAVADFSAGLAQPGNACHALAIRRSCHWTAVIAC